MKNVGANRITSTVQEVNVIIPPDGGYAWVILVAALFSNIVVDGIAFSFGTSLLPSLSQELNLPASKLAVINSVQLGTYYLFGPIACAIINHYGFRAVGVCGCVIAFSGIFVASHIASFPAILALYGVFVGMGFGMIYTSSIISVGYYFEKYRALSTGIALCGSSIGGLCLSPLFAYLVAEKGWEFTMKMQSCFILICLFSCLTYRPLKPTATVPLTEEIINEIDNLTSPSRMDFVELYKTDSLISIDLVNDSSEESRHFPQISIISSRFLPTPTIKTDKKTCCSWLRKFCLKKAQPGKNLGKLISTGPLDRKDIFYSASVLQIPEYKNIMKENTGDSRRKISYHLSMMLDPETVQLSKRFLSPRMQVVDEDTLRCFGIPHMIQKALRNLFDVSLMKSFVFCTLSAACLCYALAWITPYVYLPKRGEMNKIQEKYTRWFISSMSIGNAIGRISAGVLATFCQCLNPFYMVGIANVAAGTITVISALIGTSDVNVQFIYCIVVGFCIAFFSVLRPVMFVRVLGLGKLTNAFGLSAAMLGVGLLTGTPIASILYERTETFTWTFISCGIFFIFSGTLVILAFRIYLWQERKN